MALTFPLESELIMAKDGTIVSTRHTKYVTGEIGQEFAELAVEFLTGGTVGQLIRTVREIEEGSSEGRGSDVKDS